MDRYWAACRRSIKSLCSVGICTDLTVFFLRLARMAPASGLISGSTSIDLLEGFRRTCSGSWFIADLSPSTEEETEEALSIGHLTAGSCITPEVLTVASPILLNYFA